MAAPKAEENNERQLVKEEYATRQARQLVKDNIAGKEKNARQLAKENQKFQNFKKWSVANKLSHMHAGDTLYYRSHAHPRNAPGTLEKSGNIIKPASTRELNMTFAVKDVRYNSKRRHPLHPKWYLFGVDTPIPPLKLDRGPAQIQKDCLAKCATHGMSTFHIEKSECYTNCLRNSPN